jgi:hypothetical protein
MDNYDEEGELTKILWSDDAIGYEFCPDCGTNLSAPSGPLSDPEGEIAKEHRRSLAHIEAEKDPERHLRWVNYADGLQFALDVLGAAPVLGGEE